MKSRFRTSSFFLLAITVFFASLGQAFQSSVQTNFFVQELGLDGQRVLWLSGIREIPGLLLVFLAAFIMRLPLSRRAGAALLTMAVGFGGYGLAHSYLALATAVVVGSIGYHNWFPVLNALSMGLVKREHSGRILGQMNAVAALAGVVAMGTVILLSTRLGLRTFLLLSGAALGIAGVIVLRVPTDVGSDRAGIPRLLFRKEYWLYYVLVFFEGARTQFFAAFGSWVLVQFYHVTAAQLAMLLIASRLVNLMAAPTVGRWFDRYGERRVLMGIYLLLAAAFAAYAAVHNVWVLAATYVVISLLFLSRMGLDAHVNRIAPMQELSPTLSAGVSVNHITSVGTSLVAGSLVNTLGYEALCFAVAGIVLLSCPFAWSLRASSRLPGADRG